MSFTRIKQRTDTYANYEAINNNTPGGLKILQGEVCVVIADAASAAAGLSNPEADLIRPLRERLANTGEVLGMKIGSGFENRWDELPYHFAIPNINYANGTGRVLGTQSNGATHVYNHPAKMMKAIFGPVYSAPQLGISLLDGGNNNLNGALLEVGQVVSGAKVSVNPIVQSYRIKLGQIFENTGNRVQVGLDETAAAPNSITTFNRVITPTPFSITPALGAYNGGNGLYSRSFSAEVLDERPGVEGGNNRVGAGGLNAYAAYPTFFGKTTADTPTSESARGEFLKANCSKLLRARSQYATGVLNYVGGECAVFAYPAAYGPLTAVLNSLNSDTLAASFDAPIRALLSNGTLYQNVPYLVYRSKAPGYNGQIPFTFNF